VSASSGRSPVSLRVCLTCYRTATKQSRPDSVHVPDSVHAQADTAFTHTCKYTDHIQTVTPRRLQWPESNHAPVNVCSLTMHAGQCPACRPPAFASGYTVSRSPSSETINRSISFRQAAAEPAYHRQFKATHGATTAHSAATSGSMDAS
jgi:hypothetical protein